MYLLFYVNVAVLTDCKFRDGKQYYAKATEFWHHKTSRGGGKYNSKILPISKWSL